MDQLILPCKLKQLDTFSAGQQYREIQKHHLKLNYLLFEQQQKKPIGKITFLNSSLAHLPYRHLTIHNDILDNLTYDGVL